MKRRPKGLIETFYSKEEEDVDLVFQLLKDKDGKFHIKRGKLTIIMFSQEDKARKGFKVLRDKLAI